jgi:hypothetical protein
MNLYRLVVLGLLVSAIAAAQARSGVTSAPHSSSKSTYGSPGGFGNVVYPGTGHAPGVPAGTPNPNNAYRGGTTVGSIPIRGGHRPVTAYPYVYPILGGGYYGYGGYPSAGYGYGYGSGYGYAQDVDPSYYGNGMQQPAPPQVVINQGFLPDRANPVMREYNPQAPGDNVHIYEAPGRAPQENPAEDTPYYLLAFKDSSVYSAFAYWVDGDTLHYVTPDRVHNQVSLNLVDRDLTDRLNRDRNMQVKLPR